MLTFSNTLQRVVQQRAEKIATIDGDRRHSWKEFHQRVSQFAGALQKLGVKQGSRVAILSLNSDRYLEAMFAIPWAGAAYVPINTRLAAPEVEYWMQNSESEVLLVDRNFLTMLDHLRATLPKLKHIIFMDNGEPAEGLPHYEDLLADAEAVDAAPVQPNDLVALYYTGGTTGRSKGVMLSHHNMLFNAMQGMVVQSYSGDEIYLHAAPMFHAADAYNAICFCLLGGTHVFTPGFDPKRVLELIGEEKVTRILLVPTMVGMVMSYPELDDYDLSSLKSIFYGASPMPEAVLKAAMAKYPAMEFMQAYGQTEAAPVLTILMPEDHVPEGERSRLLKSAGKAAPGVTLAILDDDDKELPRGEIGQVCAKGDNVMLGYLGMEETTAETLKNGWLHTGDGAYMDDEGYIFIVDRVKDMIISGGENVYSVEVENALYRHPAVESCAVIGIPSEQWGEQVHAVIQTKAGAETSEQEIIAHCKELIAGFKCPRSVTLQAEPLPLSGAGKILKTELRKPFWGDKAKAVN
ncbi:MAG: long-chain-fatty-acid--CoA ligase [Cellvibrionaceae bacterium]|nr:long-chain-fatty-acid--CoA ligase [Cellvibrionaceae bacterium]